MTVREALTTMLLLGAIAASIFSFVMGALDIGLIFAMIAGAIAMGFDGR